MRRLALVALFAGRELKRHKHPAAAFVRALPVFFVIFVIQFPAGLLVYWIATNFTMIPQQYFMLRRYGRPAVPVKVESNGRGSPGAAKQAIKKPPSQPPPSARPRKKRSGRRR